MGARFRLKSSYNISSFSANTQVVLRAFQHYGLVLADNGADWFFGGTTDDWWGTTAGNQLVSELKTIPAAQFDAIDESSLQVAAGSYQASGPTPCSSVSLGPSPASPQVAGTQVTFTATASGCVNPLYEFWTRPASSSTWTMAQAYGSANTFKWTNAAGTYFIGVHTRASTSTAAYDAIAGTQYTLTSTATTCTAVTLSAAPTSPSIASMSITVTATATCPNASPQFEFWALWQGASGWIMQQAYSTTASWTWNSTGAPTGTERFGVWVKDAGSPNAYDQLASIPYTVTNQACTALSLTAAPPSPSVSGTTITVTATSTCPNSLPQYEFWALWQGASGWIMQKAYSTSATWTWNSTGAPPGTERFGVWVKDASAPASKQADLYYSTPYQVT
jgi:hypothetical protein